MAEMGGRGSPGVRHSMRTHLELVRIVDWEAQRFPPTERRPPIRTMANTSSYTKDELPAMTPTEQFEALRPQLFALSYRALGSRSDAEDIVQEAYLRWQRSDHAAIESPKAYLMKVVSRLALDVLKSARTRREQYVGVWLPEPLFGLNAPVTGRGSRATPEEEAMQAESLSLAFLFVLETLSAPQRIAFLLHDVFGYGYDEVASALDASEVACRQHVSRARKVIQERRPFADGRPRMDAARHREVLEQFFAACLSNDTTGLLNLLREDAVFYSDGGGKAAAALNPLEGPDRIARFFLGIAKQAPPDTTLEIDVVNGVPALRTLVGGTLVSLFTFDLDAEGKIGWILAHRNPDKLGA